MYAFNIIISSLLLLLLLLLLILVKTNNAVKCKMNARKAFLHDDKITCLSNKKIKMNID